MEVVDQAPSSSEDTGKRKVGRFRRWSRALAKGALVLFLLALLLRVSHPLWLPRLLDRLAAAQGYGIQYEDLDLSLFGGRLELARVVVHRAGSVDDKEQESLPEEPLLVSDYLDFDVDLSALLTGRLLVHRAEIDGLTLRATRDETGLWNFSAPGPPAETEVQDVASKFAANEVEEQRESGNNSELSAIDFRLPLGVDAMVVHGLRVRLRDHFVSPPLDVVLNMDVAVRDLGYIERPLRLDVQAEGPGLLDAFRLEMRAATDLRSLEANGSMELKGLSLSRLAPYLAQFGLNPQANELSCSGGFLAQLVPKLDSDVDLAGAIRLNDLNLQADEQEYLALDSLAMEVVAASQSNVRLGRVGLSGIRGQASRSPSGSLRFAGLELVPNPGGEERVASAKVAEPPSNDPEAALLGLEVARVELDDMQLLFVDEAVLPAVRLELNTRAELQDLVLDPARPGVPFEFALNLELVDGGSTRVTGNLVPDPNAFALEALFAVQDLTGNVLAPYLLNAGWETTLREGRMEMPVRAVGQYSDGMDVDLALGPVHFVDGQRQLFAFDLLTLGGFNIAPEGGLSVVDAVLSGLRLDARLEESGGLSALGLRPVHRSPSVPENQVRESVADSNLEASDAVHAGQPGAPNQTQESAGLRLDHLALEDCVVHLESDQYDPPLDLQVATEFSLDGLVLGAGDEAAQPEPARLSLELRSDGLVNTMRLAGGLRVGTQPLNLGLDLGLEAEGLRSDAIAGLLAAAGWEGTLDSGTLAANLSVELTGLGQGLGAQVELSDLALVDQSHELLALDLLRVQDAVLEPDGVRVAAVRVVGPRASLGRNADGSLELPGLRALAPAPLQSPSQVAETKKSEGPTVLPVDPLASGAAQQETQPREQTERSFFALQDLSLEETRLAWSDAAVSPPVDVTFLARANLHGLDTRQGAEAMAFELETNLGEEIGTVSLTGRAQADPDRLTCDLGVEGTGLHAGSLANYLPPGVESTLRDGRLGLRLSASSLVREAGGRSLDLRLSDLQLQDQDKRLLTLGDFHIDVPRFDPGGPSLSSNSSAAQTEGGAIEIEEVVLDGLEFGLEQTAEGLELLGLRLSAARDTDTPSSENQEQQAGEQQVAASESSASAETKESTPPARLPSVRLGQLRLGPSKVTFRDRVAGGEAIEIALALGTEEPQVLLSPDPEELPPIQFYLKGRAAPELGAFRTDVELSPFAGEPRLLVGLRADGLNGDALIRAWPSLADQLDASDWANGSLGLDLEAALQAARRGPTDFNLARGFGAQVVLTNAFLRPTPDADPVLGLERLGIELQRYQPLTGEAQLKSVELIGTRARLRQEAEGLRVAGVLLKSPPTARADSESTESTSNSADKPALEPDMDSMSGAGRQAPASPELRLDELLVTGLDFLYEDVSVDPPFVLPIADLEMELKGFTSRMFDEPKSVSFHALFDAGDVLLPERGGSDNLLAGVLGSLSDVVTSSEEKYKSEQRRLWDQFEFDGRVALFPQPEGRANLVVSGLELPAFRGLAREAGVEIGDGLVDSKLDLRLRGEEGVGLNLSTTLDSLSLSEPADGPISQYLHLPAPLDTVLFLLRNEEGEQEIPLRVNVPTEGLSTGAIATAAATALGNLIVDALASAPARMLGPLTDLVGQLGLAPELPSPETVSLTFAPGTTLPGYTAAEQVLPLLESLRADPNLRLVLQHELGRQDIERAEQLANPKPAQALELVTRLRDRKAAISRERGELAALVRAQWAVGAADEAEQNASQLKQLDRELLQVEEALDRVLALTRPGAERRRGQRTRLAALSLARERMRLTEELIERLGGRGLASQLDLRRPRFSPTSDDDSALPELGSVSLTPRLKN